MLTVESQKIKSLSGILPNVQDVIKVRDLSDEDQTILHGDIKGCYYVLADLERILGQYRGFDTVSKSIDNKRALTCCRR